MPDNEGQEAPDLAGYPSVDELAKGYRNSSAEGKRQKERADMLEQQMTTMLQQQQQAQRTQARTDPASRLADLGVPVDALDEFIESRVSNRVNQALQPLAQGVSARQRIMTQYPDYAKYEPQVNQFIESDPELQQRYNRMFQSDPQGALEYAMLKYSESHPARSNGNGRSRPTREAAVEAQIPSSRSGESRDTPNAEDEYRKQAWDHFQKTGDPVRFAKARLRQVISDEFLNR